MAAHDPERVFGDVAEAYDATRPGYPDELIRDLVELAGVRPGRRVLEVGCGTGKATRLVAPTGASLTAIDPAAGMLAVARRTCSQFKNVEFVESKFEQFETPYKFDLVYSAQAFHWVDPAIGFRKSAELLNPRGSFALLWNSPQRTHGRLSDEIDRAYAAHAPDMRPASIGLTRRNSLDAIRGSGLFAGVEAREYRWSLTYTADEWVKLLGTHSDHRILHDSQRDRLLRAIHRAITDHGGRIEETMLSTLQVARAKD